MERTGRTATLATDAGGHLVLRRIRVRVVAGDDQGAEVMIEEGRVLVGSGAGADLVLHDRGVSRMHVELGLVPHGVRVVDLGSRNGTFVGEVRIESIVVSPGTAVKVGHTQLSLEAADVPVEDPVSPRSRFGSLVGVSEPMRRVFAILERVAPTDLPLWIEGEPGTGKGEAGRSVHAASPRARGSFLVIDAAGPLVRGELARRSEQARGGSVLVDHADAAPGWVTAELIGVLDRVERGELDVRVLATAGSRPAPGGDATAELRARLAGVRLVLPPLRERREDVGLILAELATRMFGQEISLEPSDVESLRDQAFPGNVHDLRRLVDASAAEGPAGAGPTALPAGAWASDSDALATLPFKEAKGRLVDAFERHYVQQLLERHDGDLVQAAQEAGVVRHHLAALARKHGLIE